jgi:hypothetical protein
MAKGPAKKDAPTGADATPVGPPLLLVALGYASVLVSLPLIVADAIPAHVVGYVTGALIPILVIGFVRRVDLGRRRSPYYVPRAALQPALVILAILAIVAAGLHVWPVATELAS